MIKTLGITSKDIPTSVLSQSREAQIDAAPARTGKEKMEKTHIIERGAHTKDLNFNAVGIGICVVGNFDVETPPMKCFASFIDTFHGL